MTALQVVSLYAGLNIILLIILGINVIRLRGATKTSLGHGDHPALERACRAHGNAAEWMPGALIGLVLMALIGAPVMALHALGMTLTIGRSLHGWGVATKDGSSMARFVGMLMTLLVYIGLGLGLTFHAVTG